MSEERYLVELGIDFDSGKLDNIEAQIKNLTEKEHTIKFKFDKTFSSELNNIQNQLREIGNSNSTLNLGKDAKTSITNVVKLDKSFDALLESVNEIKRAFGSLDDGSGAKSLLVTISQIGDELTETARQFKELSATMNNMQLNVNVGGINSGNNISNLGVLNSQVRASVLPQLKQQVAEIEAYLKEYYNAVDGSSAAGKLVSKTGLFDKFNTAYTGMTGYNEEGKKASLIYQVEQTKEYINVLKEAARLQNIDLSPITSGFSKSADDLLEDAQKILSGEKQIGQQAEETAKQIQNLFGGNNTINADGLSSQLESIIQKLKELNEATVKLSDGVSLKGLSESFNGLSESIRSLVDNCKIVKEALSGVGDVAKQSLDKASDVVVDSSKTKQTAQDATDKAYNKFLALTGKKSSGIFRGRLDSISPILEGDVNELKRFSDALDNIDDVDGLNSIVQSLVEIREKAESVTPSVNEIKDTVSARIDTTATQNEIKEVTTVVDNYGRELDDVHSKLLATSKMMNTQGKLITLFHGSPDDFDSFDIAASDRHSNNFGQGAYFYDDPSASIGYGNVSQWFANVEKIFQSDAYLSTNKLQIIFDKYKSEIKNIWDIDNLTDFVANVNKNPINRLRSLSDSLGLTTDNDLLKELGYDAIINKGHVSEYIILDESKIFKANSALKEQVKLITDIQQAKAMEASGDPKRNFNYEVMFGDKARRETTQRVRQAEQSSNEVAQKVIHNEQKVAQESEITTNVVIQNEKEKQQAIQRTADVVKEFSTNIDDIGIENTATHIDRMKDALNEWGFNSDSIDTLTHDLENINLEITNITTKLKKDGSLDIAIKGIDTSDPSRTITSLKRYAERTDEHGEKTGIWELFYGENIVSQSFKQSKEIIDNYKQLIALQKQIGADEIKLAGLDTNTEEYKALSSVVDNLKYKYQSLYDTIEQDLNQSQISNLKNIADTTSDKISVLLSKQIDTEAYKKVQAEIKETEQATKDLVNITKQMGSKEAELTKLELDPEINQSKINDVKNDLKELEIQYDNLYDKFEGKFNSNQFDRLNSSLDEATKKVRDANSSIASTAAHKKLQAEIDETNRKFERLLSLSKELDNLDVEIVKLDGTDNAKELTTLTNIFDRLSDEYQELANSLHGKLSDDQLLELGDQAQKAEDKIEKLKSKLEDTKAKISKNITGKMTDSKIADDLDKIERSFKKLQNPVEATSDAYENFVKSSKDLKKAIDSNDIDKINEAYKQYERNLKNVNNQLNINKRAEEESAKARKLEANKKDFELQIDVWAKKYTAALKEFGEEVDEIKAKIKSCNDIELDGLKAEFKAIDKQADLKGLKRLSFFDGFKDKFAEYSRYFSVAELFSEATMAIRDMFEQVKEIDSAMTDLMKVTDETAASYDRFLDGAGQKAQELGRSVSSFVQQSAEWAKMGYNTVESADLAKVSSVYSNVADVDDATAVSDIVTAMKAYNIEAEKAITIIDPMNKLSNEFAVTAAGLGQGLSRAASTMATSGTDLEHTLALLTGISEITQSPEEAGNFLKTALARIQGKLLCPSIVKTIVHIPCKIICGITTI